MKRKKPNTTNTSGLKTARECIRTLLPYCFLIVGTFLVFWQVMWFDFINYDDPTYVTTNEHVLKGVSVSNIHWAFTNLEGGFWQPLMWLSYLLDVELFGVH